MAAMRSGSEGLLGRRYGLQLDAERAYARMVGHLEECLVCDRAGGELATPAALCPTGRHVRDAWERTERQLVSGR